MEIHRLDQVKIESCFFAAPNVFVGAKSGESDGFQRLFSFCLGDHIVAGSIGKTNVAQDYIELLRLDGFQSALRIIGDRNLVAEISEQTRQRLQCIAMIFYKQNAQRFSWFFRALGTHFAFFDALRYRVKCDLNLG